MVLSGHFFIFPFSCEMFVVSRLETVIEETEMEKKIRDGIKFPVLPIKWMFRFYSTLVVNHDKTFRPVGS